MYTNYNDLMVINGSEPIRRYLLATRVGSYTTIKVYADYQFYNGISERWMHLFCICHTRGLIEKKSVFLRTL